MLIYFFYHTINILNNSLGRKVDQNKWCDARMRITNKKRGGRCIVVYANKRNSLPSST